jgi:hypothetical protein
LLCVPAWAQNYGAGVAQVTKQVHGNNYLNDPSCEYAAVFAGADAAAMGADQCGGDHDLSVAGAPTRTTSGLPTGSPLADAFLQFDGAADYLYGIDAAGEFDAFESLDGTVGCWISPDAAESGNPPIFAKWSGSTGWWLAAHSLDTNDYGWGIVNAASEYTPASEVANPGWTHLAMAWDDDDDVIKLYADGEEKCSAPCNATTDLTANNANVTIGRFVASYWDGGIYECWVFSRELEPEEICEICRFGVAGDASDRKTQCNSCTLP